MSPNVIVRTDRAKHHPFTREGMGVEDPQSNVRRHRMRKLSEPSPV